MSNKLRDFLNHNQETDAAQGRPPDTEAAAAGAEQDTVQTAGAEAQAGTETEPKASAGEQQTQDSKQQDQAPAGAQTAADTAGTKPEAEAAAEPEAEAKQEEPAQPVHDPKDDQIADLQKRLLRLQADFENFRRRNAAEREELSTFVTMDIVGKYLKILDTFERGLAAAQKAPDVASIVTGMENTQRLFLQTMTELGVKEIPALNQKFDPKLHEAVMRGQNPDLEDETIDAVFEKGYELRNHVIRHSKVRVINNE
ncbi:MAG: nucleotide exchange factor GrpE [Acidaminococcaceae bacterium]|nr:nucleotide exchange factor GrpE [Acidaminococcaceae bacterium]